MIQRRLAWAVALCCLLAVPRGAEATTSATVNATITVFAALTFSPAPLAFGNEQIGHSVTKSITVTNNGTGTFVFSVSLAAGTNSSEFSLSPVCNGSLSPTSSCQISVTFAPTIAGTANAGVVLSGAGRSYTAFFSGTGTVAPVVTPASIALSPSSIQIQDNATGGSIVSTAAVTMSDGSANNNCTLRTSNTSYYQISGMQVVLAHDLGPGDDGQRNTDISVVSCP